MAKKNVSSWLVRALQTLTTGALLLSPVAHSQAMSTGAKTATAPSVTQGQIQAMQSQIQMMQGQVQALVARVKSLEDQAQLASGDSGDDKQSKAIERRLQALEEEQAKQSAREEKASDMPELLTRVVAPFEVVDKAGKTIVRIAATDNKTKTTRGLLVYDDTGQPAAQLGITHWGGLLSIISPKTGPNAPDILLGMGSDGPKFQLQEGGKKVFVLDKESLAFYGDGDLVLSDFGTRKGKGYLELDDSNGVRLEAGVLANDKGYVLAYPWENSVEPHGDPSVLMGGRMK